MLTQENLKEALHYDKDTGLMTWRRPKNRPKLIGTVAGTPDGAGYVLICIDSTLYRAHRLAFLYMTGEIPPLVDHINGIKNDNRWTNLRESDKVRNAQNIHKSHRDSKSGLLGVEVSRKRFAARISAHGKRITIGTFDTAEEAHAAYLDAKKVLHEGASNGDRTVLANVTGAAA